MKRRLFLIHLAFALTTIAPVFGQHALLWDPNTGIRDLGTLGSYAEAYAVNDSSTVVGIYAPNDGRLYYHGFVWTEATGMVDIGVPGGGDSDTAEVFCYAINSNGNVVGSARQVDGQQVAFFWSPTDGFTTLGNFSSSADNGNVAYAINDLDQVTGNLLIGHGFLYHGFIWSPGTHPRDLGVVDGAQYSVGMGINNLSRIAGASLSTSDFVFEPMGWTKRLGIYLLGMVPGTVFSEALGINDAGEIVGLDETGTSELAFYTAPGIGLKFLKGLGGNSTSAHAINQSGVIVGFAEDTTNHTYGVRWLTPTSVPEVLPMDNALGINNLGQIVGF